MLVNKAKTLFPSTVFRSLGQVLRTLTAPEIISHPEVQQVLRVAVESDLIAEKNGNYEPNLPLGGTLKRDANMPFIVIEGLDGCGKTTMTEHLRQTMQLKLLSTPPESLKPVRSWFEQQPERVKRAYYALGNYLVAQEVGNTQVPVIMDRFWHSTAAYAYAHLLRTGVLSPDTRVMTNGLAWPEDLLRPDLVMFLTVSEEERVRRHTSRQNFTNTAEEQILASDRSFRENLSSCYQSITGVTLEVVNVDDPPPDAKTVVTATTLRHFPFLFPKEGLTG